MYAVIRKTPSVVKSEKTELNKYYHAIFLIIKDESV
jgi:hypothetical protein